mmetsp:Transcript_12506/g.12272  ORF Transcript_12506/g.12272 Transcript_12506/m.12272 type:complete len:287 (+) Transcript_12506:500-1360(+)
MPAVFFDGIDLTGLELHLLYVLVTPEGVDVGPLDAHGRKEGLLLEHLLLRDDVLVNVLQTVRPHPPQQEPRPHVLVVLKLLTVLLRPTYVTPIDIHQCEVAAELTLVFGDEPPLGELLRLGSFNEQPPDLVPPELKPEHLVDEVEVELVLVGIALEELALGHQVLLGLFHLSFLPSNLYLCMVGDCVGFLVEVADDDVLFEVLAAKGLVHFLLLLRDFLLQDVPRSGSSSLSSFGRLYGVLGGSQHQLGQLYEAWPVILLELQHQPDYLNDVVGVTLSELFQALIH